MTSEELSHNLSQFIGTEEWYRHNLNRNFLYTDGVQYFATHGGTHGAYWLLDIFATEVWALTKKEEFIHIKVVVSESKARITADDGSKKLLWSRDIDYTDLQEGVWSFYLTGGVCMLKSEY